MDKVIRRGDLVRVIMPRFFVRCGYPLSFEQAVAEVTEQYGDRIIAFLRELDLTEDLRKTPQLFGGIKEVDPKDNRTFKKVARALAFDYVRAKGFGGRERRIYREYRPRYFNRLMRVDSVRFHATGEYYPPTGGYDPYSGEYDCDPGGLENQKQHKVLTVWPVMEYPYQKGHFQYMADRSESDIKIEAVNVRKEVQKNGSEF